MIHPRKEQDDTLLNISSVFGTAKATQEADNVLILQRIDGQKMIDIRKNRYDGVRFFIIIFFQMIFLFFFVFTFLNGGILFDTNSHSFCFFLFLFFIF